MMLGKRTRPPMNRTTSMKELTLDLSSSSSNNKSDDQEEGSSSGCITAKPLDPHNPFLSGSHKQPIKNGRLDQRLTALSKRTGRRHSADFLLETSPFLKACSLCKLHFIPGRDIYMYRGDSGFCSVECRQHQMNEDERKEKCSLATKMEVAIHKVTGPQVQSTTETVAAV